MTLTTERAIRYVLLTMLVGCGEKLQGTTWEGNYDRSPVIFEFVSGDVAKRTLYSSVDDLTYAVDGKLVKFTTQGTIVSTLNIDNGSLVGTPADIGITKNDTTTKIVLAKKK